MEVYPNLKTRLLVMSLDDWPYQAVVILKPVVRVYRYSLLLARRDAIQQAAEDTMIHTLALGRFEESPIPIPSCGRSLQSTAEEMIANPQDGHSSLVQEFWIQFYTDSNNQLAAKLA